MRELGHEVQAGSTVAGLNTDLLVDKKFVVEIDGLEDNVRPTVSNMKK